MKQFHLLPIHFAIWLSLAVFALPASSRSQEHPSSDMAVLRLNSPIRFLNENRTSITIPPGTYHVSATLPETIQLTSSSAGTVWNLRAATITHTESPTIPYPLIIEDGKDRGQMHLVLLLPEGQGLDAEGRMGAILSRGAGDLTKSTLNATRRYTGVVMQQGRVSTDRDWNESDAVSSAENSVQSSNTSFSYGRVMLEGGRFQLDKDARHALFRRCKTCFQNP